MPTVQEALDQMDAWFALCPEATFQVVVSSDAAPPEDFSTHSRHLALHFVATALEPTLAVDLDRGVRSHADDAADEEIHASVSAAE